MPTKKRAAGIERLSTADKRLLQQAIDKAEREGNEYVLGMFSRMDAKKVSDGDRELLNEFMGM